MPVVFHIPGYLRQFTEGQKRVAIDVSRRVVRDAFEDLCRKYPGIKDRVLTETGEVRPHVNIFVAAESIRYTGGLDTPIAEREEVFIVPAVSGGSGSKASNELGVSSEGDRAPEVDEHAQERRAHHPAVAKRPAAHREEKE